MVNQNTEQKKKNKQKNPNKNKTVLFRTENSNEAVWDIVVGKTTMTTAEKEKKKSDGIRPSLSKGSTIHPKKKKCPISQTNWLQRRNVNEIPVTLGFSQNLSQSSNNDEPNLTVFSPSVEVESTRRHRNVGPTKAEPLRLLGPITRWHCLVFILQPIRFENLYRLLVNFIVVVTL